MANYNSSAVGCIRSALTMDEVARHYGYQPNRAGYICCPFHQEKTPSLKLYPGDRGFNCFGCHASGDVITFVRMLFDISFASALVRISFDFGLNIADGKPDDAQRARVDAERVKAARAARDTEDKLNALCAEFRRLWAAYRQSPPSPLPNGDIEINDEWAEAARRLDALEYKINCLEEILDRNRKNAYSGATPQGKAG